MKLTVAKRTRSICRVLLILMIFSLFVTGCGQNIDTNPDNDGGDPNTNVVTVLENGFKPSNDADVPLSFTVLIEVIKQSLILMM